MWRVWPPQAGWWASTGAASVANSRCRAFSQGVPVKVGAARVSSSPTAGAPGSAPRAALTYSIRIGAGPERTATGTGSCATSPASIPGAAGSGAAAARARAIASGSGTASAAARRTATTRGTSATA
jgi:hypothetical protein